MIWPIISEFKASARGNSAAKLKTNDIVLATYAELMKSIPWPDKKTVTRIKKEGKTVQKYIAENIDKVGGLHQIDWYRVSVLRKQQSSWRTK